MLKVKRDMIIRDLCKMFKYCINRGRFVSVYASIKSDANQQAQANKRASVVKLTSDRLKRQASRRDNMNNNETLKDRVAELSKQNTLLADHLASLGQCLA